MAKPFFPQDWESLTVEELATARAKLAGFIEAVPDREKIIREGAPDANHLIPGIETKFSSLGSV
ncbi:hypothetical protein OUZ56_006159 [Daphnia magna]|uniref:Uncharacterized protein n=1 Tax=Daphnia magna TaxID=35525 RepID=A0ABQ9YUX6_9CRUS|nr:hypothetical protein OUZ56_006159 [Daphnia magna]